MHSNTSSIDDLVNWTSQICPDGLLPFRPDSRLLNPCFKQLCALLPICTLLALVSAFRLGRLSTADTEIRRPFVHRMLLYARMVIVWLLIVQAPAQYAWTLWTHDNVSDLVAWPIELLVGGAQTIAFFIHFGKCQELCSEFLKNETINSNNIYIYTNIKQIFKGFCIAPKPRQRLYLIKN